MSLMKRPDYIVRHMNFIDNDPVLDILQSLRITVGNHTNLTMLKVDPHCLFVAEDTDTGQILGVCSGFNINRELAFVGEYAVLPQFQKFGIGIALWKRCIEHCSKRNCAIFPEPKTIPTVREKSGFQVIPARRMIAYSGRPQIFELNKYIDYCDVEYITVHNLVDIIEYDEQITGINRAQFLEMAICEPGTISLLARYIENGNIAGYAIFKTTNDNSISPQPLYANTDEIAEALTYNGIVKFVGFDGLYLEAWDVNCGANYLAERLGLTATKRLPIMFTKEDLSANYKRIYFIGPSSFYPF